MTCTVRNMTKIPLRVKAAGVAAGLTLALIGFNLPASAAAAESPDLAFARDQLRNCQLVQGLSNLTSAERNDANRCVSMQTKLIAVLTAVSPSPSPSASVSASPSASPSVSPSPTPTPTPTGPPGARACPAFPAMPDASCTGVPPGVTLKACPLTAGTINTPGAKYDSCLFSGTVFVRANNVTITRSKIAGGRVDTGYGAQTGLVLTDVEIDGQNSDPNGQSAIGDNNYTCLRCNVWRTGRGAAVGSNVTIRDSWFHDFFKTPGAHMSGIGSNGGSNNVIVHNNIDCQVTSCSGALVAYGDFSPINNWLVQNNLLASPGSYCTYAGSTGVASGKPYPHGTNIQYISNRWSTKYTSVCGMYGPVTAWEWNAGNVWTGNAYTDGRVINV